MIYCLITVTIALFWMLVGTDFLRIRLPYGAKIHSGIKLLNPGKIETVLMLPEAKRGSYFIPCDIPENSDVVSKNIVSVGAKIIY